MPRGRPREFDKDVALDLALRMFWRHGFEGTSTAALADRLGITPPSLYLAFGNKESLFMKAVDHYGRYSSKFYEDAFKQISAREVARSILLGEVELVSGENTPEGCLMIQSALATSPGSERIEQRMAELRRNAETDVVRRFERAEKEGDLPAGWAPNTLASYVMTVAAGLAVQAKTGVSRDELLAVVKTAMLIWPDGDNDNVAPVTGGPAR